jgi:hypothetical protein
MDFRFRPRFFGPGLMLEPVAGAWLTLRHLCVKFVACDTGHLLVDLHDSGATWGPVELLVAPQRGAGLALTLWGPVLHVQVWHRPGWKP